MSNKTVEWSGDVIENMVETANVRVIKISLYFCYNVDFKGGLMSLIQEFKAFAVKGNVLDLAVGVIIGGAFGKIVVKDVIMPIIGKLGGQPDFSSVAIGATKVMKDGKEVLEGGIMIGNFINAVIGFIILAAVVFFVIVKPASKLMAPKPAAPAPAGPPPATLDDVVAALKELKK
jgi:large conductance mechanosensitive channel